MAGYNRKEVPVAMVREAAYGNYIGLDLKNVAGAVAAVKQGLPVAAAEALGQHLDIPIRALSRVTNIPERTLLRRKREKEALKPDESERVLRISLLAERATEVLGGLEDARAWLKSPNRALGGNTPLDYADTEPGAREVEALLGRLEHGVFS